MVTIDPAAAERYQAELKAEQHERDWKRWERDGYWGDQKGSPPDGPRLDAAIDHFAGDYPEKSQLEIQQEEVDADARENWSSTYPNYEGPGYTEPPLNWCGENHDPSWTFTRWAADRGYSPDEIGAVNSEYLSDVREEAAMEETRREFYETDEVPVWQAERSAEYDMEPGE